ncbi:hypothetical protein HHUSO_G5370 [Huso huso]|uniref:Gypsy retrotransposon integrase-like protein 1 n=1 Tax=Huso huso TaxID=61971 RepID=A0ABR1A1C6_HUSHU
MSRSKLEQVKQLTSEDPELQTVTQFVKEGWSKYAANVPESIKPYYSEKNCLSLSKGILLHGNRITIPKSLRQEIIERLHDGHYGITKCRERAKMSVWWPGIGKEIQNTIQACKVCQEAKPTQHREPLMTTPLPDRPWKRVGADICELQKKHYLIAVDYFSRYIEIAYLPDMISDTVISRLKNIFARWGCPNELVTDNGPQFKGRGFREFAYDFHHVTTSPHYSQANGEVERAVQTAKRILKQKDQFLALLSYRATPLQATGVSPAQLMLGRQLRTTVPTIEKNLNPKWPNFKLIRKADDKAKESYRRFYNRRNSAKELPELRPGDKVAVKLDGERGWVNTATVLRLAGTPRSYLVQMDRGILRRNRRHLRLIKENFSHLEEQEEESEEGQKKTQATQDLPDIEEPDPPQSPVRVTSRGRIVKRPIRYRSS